MRIIGGRFRGTRLAEVGAGDTAAHLRPTSDRVREAIFNLLINGGYGSPLDGARVLDLFAGTGALGLEALSRGAVQATFMENGKAALALLARNITLTRTASMTDILRRDATRPGPIPGVAYDLVFLDPPYGKSMGGAALGAALAGGWLAQDAVVVWEDGVAPVLPPGVDQLDQRKYGVTIVTIAQVTA